LASTTLALALRRLPADWAARYGVTPLLVERLWIRRGIRAAIARRIGSRWARPRPRPRDHQDARHGVHPKRIFVYPLGRDARTRLRGVIRAAQDFDAFYADRPTRARADPETGPILVLTADAKGVVMRPQDLREATWRAAETHADTFTARLGRGRRLHAKRMASVAAVYTVAPVDGCADYLLKYAPYIQYDKALTEGLPIASGVVEGACRYLVLDRMNVTSARWSLAGAEAVLQLRAVRASDDFDDYWAFHERQEYQRHHAVYYPGHRVPATIPRPSHSRAARRRPALKIVKKQS
jgi:hypothetical protein